MSAFANKKPASSIIGLPTNNNQQREEREPSLYWANIGYTADTTDTQTGELTTTFVSLRNGVALDSIVDFDLTKTNDKMAPLRDGQNKLRAMFMEVAESLKPGEAQIVNVQVEVRRIKAPSAAEVVGENALAPKFSLV